LIADNLANKIIGRCHLHPKLGYAYATAAVHCFTIALRFHASGNQLPTLANLGITKNSRSNGRTLL